MWISVIYKYICMKIYDSSKVLKPYFFKTMFSNFGNVSWEKLKGILNNEKVV